MSNPTIAIVPQGQGFAVSIPGEAIRLKTQAIELAGKIKKVSNAEEQEAAIAVVSQLKGLSNGVEKSREAVKKPYLEAGRAIDAKAKEYASDLDVAAKYIECMIGDFQRVERAKVESERTRLEMERRKADQVLRDEQEKAAKAERDRIAAEKAAQEAEERRLQAEIDAAEAKGAADKKKAQAELRKQEAAANEAEKAREAAETAALQAEIDASEAQEAASEASAIVYTPEPPKAAGASIRETVDFEVVDIEEFEHWDTERRSRVPSLQSFIKKEVDRARFKQFCNIMPDTALDEIPGIKFTRTTKAAVRSAAPQLSLQLPK